MAPTNILVVELLLDKGAEVDTLDGQGKTPLYLASCLHRSEAVSLLLDRGANVEGKAPNRPLRAALHNYQFAVAKSLLEHGAPATKIDLRLSRGLAKKTILRPLILEAIARST